MIKKTETDIREDIKNKEKRIKQINERQEIMTEDWDYGYDEEWKELEEERYKLLSAVEYAKTLID